MTNTITPQNIDLFSSITLYLGGMCHGQVFSIHVFHTVKDFGLILGQQTRYSVLSIIFIKFFRRYCFNLYRPNRTLSSDKMTWEELSYADVGMGI